MSRTVTLSQFMPYGAPELQSVARPYMARALVLSALLSPLLFASLALVRLLPGAGAAPPAHTMFVVDLPPPASIVPHVLPPVAPAGGARAAAGVPVPVRDEAADPSATIAPQEDLRAGTGHEATGEGAPIVIQPQEAAVEDEPHPWVYTDELPVAITRVQPEYPDLAREAGVEGRVFVHMLVGRDGRVLKAEVEPRIHVLMLDGAALAAARKWVFKPALANGHAVEVWVAVPFDFRLH